MISEIDAWIGDTTVDEKPGDLRGAEVLLNQSRKQASDATAPRI
jgi:hypothetical protein